MPLPLPKKKNQKIMRRGQTEEIDKIEKILKKNNED